MLKNNIRTLNEIIFQNNSKNYSAATAIVVLFIAMMVLIGWQFDIEPFKHPIPEIVGMNPMSAVALILAATSLLLLIKTPKKIFAVPAKILAAGSLAIGAMKLVPNIIGFDLRIDYWLYKQALQADLINNVPNAIAPDSALNLIFIGAALLLVRAQGKSIFVSNFFVLLAAFVSLLSIIGYTYGAYSFSEVGTFLPMAFHSAICFLLLSIGILCAESDKGFMAAVTGPYRGGQILQLLLPIAIIVPVLFGLLRLYGERNGFYSNSFGTALFATANIIIFFSTI